MNGDAPHFLRPPPLVTAIPWNYHTHCGGTLFLLSQRLHCGDEKLHRLQKFHAVRERWPPIEVIVTSARGHIGADDLPERGRYFAKPYDVQALSQVFQEMAGADD